MDEATRSLLLRALATRAGVSPEILTGDPNALANADGDPMTALLVNSFAQQKQQTAPEPPPEATRRADLAELRMLRERCDALAAAIGACYLCWGDDSLCEVCLGNGVPGSAVPDRALFRQLIVPAIRRAKQAFASTVPAKTINVTEEERKEHHE